MKFNYRYYGATAVDNGADSQSFTLAPDTLRPPTHFAGWVKPGAHGMHLALREALSALHAVVVNDQRPRGRNPQAYQDWLQANEGELLSRYMAEAGDLRERARDAGFELARLREKKAELLKPFYTARQKYFAWLFLANRDAWFVLDPVITVHPDRLLFEAFSQDESSYCAVSLQREAFREDGEAACGTTNIDYSASLLEEFQKIRDYKATRFAVDPSGFGVATEGDPAFREEKIDLPDSWVRGFLQVSSAAALPATVLELHPMDLHNLCSQLRRRREQAGPRSLRFELLPQQGLRVLMEPWGTVLPLRRARLLSAPAGLDLAQGLSVRVWGRRRLLVLERLIALAQRVRVHLLGSGLPSFWVLDLPGVTVTLGLSGWSANDWSSAGRFDLLQPRQAVGQDLLQQVGQALQRRWQASAAELAQATGLHAPDVAAALTLWVQAGRAVFDLAAGRYAWRELAREPLPLDSLRFASPEEEAALKLVRERAARLRDITADDRGFQQVSGELPLRPGAKPPLMQPVLVLDSDERLVHGQCQCNFFQQNRLRRGPCAHMLALRQLAQPALNARRAGPASAGAESAESAGAPAGEAAA
jgi:hypothetical protein